MKKAAHSPKRSGAGTLTKGLIVLEAVERASQPLTLQEIAAVTGIQRLAVHRLMMVLQQRGYVVRGEDKRFRAASRRRRLLLGYCAPLTGNTFRQDVAASLQRSAVKLGVDLMLLENSPEDSGQLLRNADVLIEARVDLAIFFQPVELLGHMIADRLSSAGVHFITVERPIHGGVYFGANNYQAGKLAGQALGHYAKSTWNGRFDNVVLLEGAFTSTNVHARLAGVLVGLRDFCGEVEESRVVHLSGNANREASRAAMAELLEGVSKRSRLLLSGFNDLSAVGALEAVRAAGRDATVAIVGHNASLEGRMAIRQPGSSFIASVAYFPERYGEKILRIASALVNGDVVPPAVYTDHLVIDRNNVDKLYPQDEHPAGAE
jgi:ribose transport system substrate-binding protein